MTGLADTLTTAALGQPQAIVMPPQVDPNEQKMLELTNYDRQMAGLSALQADPALLSIARQRALQQQGPQPLNHYDPNGMLAFLEMFRQSNTPYPAGAGENLARSYPWQPQAIEQALLNSPAHRANIMAPQWTRMAVGAWNDPTRPSGDLAELYR